jgi:hypothetical protein
VVKSCAIGTVTSSRKPPAHVISRMTARWVMLGSFTETRVSGVLTASLRLLSDGELSLNQVVAPGLPSVKGSDTSSAYTTASGCLRTYGFRSAMMSRCSFVSTSPGQTAIACS